MATMAKKAYGAKKDANHKPIADGLVALGCSVLDLSAVGGGCPDLLVSHRGVLYLLEIKNRKTGYGRRGLNPLQRVWHQTWRGTVHVVEDLDDALSVLGLLHCVESA